ncbi:MAG: AlpA family transcriptional regulator [Methyloprofundus sp.]|nr:AlpA family transcriptional regulator [Methyloprofundus sp.]
MRFLRLKDVTAITGVSRSQIYNLMGNGHFPRSVKLTERTVVWIESEIHEWMEKKITERFEKTS